jgi:hypothetical protein
MGSSVKLFSEYRKYSDILIETGTWFGDGVQCAFDAGYEKVYSCDINSECVLNAKKRFKDRDFTAVLKPSELALKDILDDIDQRCIIFLDGHAMPKDGHPSTREFGSSTLLENALTCPLMEELQIIKDHHIKDHVILIDDFQCFDTWCFNQLSYDDVLNFVSTINPKYKSLIKNDVVCFEVK